MFSLSMMDYFYPRPPRGGRPGQLKSKGAKNIFLSTPSARRATPSTVILHNAPGYFYPRPPRGGRPEVKKGVNIVFEFLSTPSARRATRFCRRASGSGTISIHALREEGDLQAIKNEYKLTNFYPRPPRGGRRLWPSITPPSWPNFYPRPPRGGRRKLYCGECGCLIFLSTPSARRATNLFVLQ